MTNILCLNNSGENNIFMLNSSGFEFSVKLHFAVENTSREHEYVCVSVKSVD